MARLAIANKFLPGPFESALLASYNPSELSVLSLTLTGKLVNSSAFSLAVGLGFWIRLLCLLSLAIPTQLTHCSSLVEILRYRAQHQPNQIAYIGLENGETECGRLTYAQLDLQARAIAAHLQALGASGSRVLLTFPLSDGLAFTTAFFGCLYAGAIAVTAWPPLNESLLLELQYKAADAEVMFALTTQELMARLSEPFAATPPLDQIHWIETDQLDEQNADAWKMPEIEAKTLAYLQYTSGSTGLPKGAMISHGNVLNNLAMIYDACQYTAQDIGICWLPLYHDLGLVCAVIQPVYAGGPAVMMSPVDFILKPLRWLQAISRYRGTISGGPNFAFELCLRKITPEQRKGLDLSSWAIAGNGAEPVLSDTLERFAAAFAPSGFRSAAFCPAYGMAETTVMISTTARDTAPVVKSIQRAALEKNKVEFAPRECFRRECFRGEKSSWLWQNRREPPNSYCRSRHAETVR